MNPGHSKMARRKQLALSRKRLTLPVGGAPAGLFRFNGVRFELFRSPFGDQLPSTGVSALFAPATGGLWVGYFFGGFSFLKNGRVTNFVETTGAVGTFAQDRHGIVWAGSGRGLWRFDGSSWQHIGTESNAPRNNRPDGV